MSSGQQAPQNARRVLPPERLGPHHDLSSFENGRHPSLDDWLKRRALASEGLSARAYVICDAGAPTRVVGYYAIATAMERRAALPRAQLRRGMPEEVPLLLIGRLALDRAWQGLGLGTNLLADALRRCLAASDIAGARGIIVRAIDDEAAQFYQRHGFLPSPLGPGILLMPIETVRALFVPS
ncbi:MAG: GNAT family N-acetyltransferase [Magnetospirillum sp.]|nr:GNAT family N-acetyltransferase [Magnetospirillum sp.]